MSNVFRTGVNFEANENKFAKEMMKMKIGGNLNFSEKDIV